MKYLVTGLGNPGFEYVRTRHNIGFMVVEALAEKHSGVFTSSRLGHTCQLRIRSRPVVLLKPSTFMNLSGKAVRHHLQDQKLDITQLLVVTDDINLPFGKLRMKGQGSHGGHNGLGDIQEVLGTTTYTRLRIGVGSEFSKGRQADYVLSEFESGEQIDLPQIIKKAVEAIECFITLGLAPAMTRYNN